MYACCSFTLEVSFAGPNTGKFAGTHYDTNQLESIGVNLAMTLLDYSDPVKASQAMQHMQTVQQAASKLVMGSSPVGPRRCGSSASVSDGSAAVSVHDWLTFSCTARIYQRRITALLSAVLACNFPLVLTKSAAMIDTPVILLWFVFTA